MVLGDGKYIEQAEQAGDLKKIEMFFAGRSNGFTAHPTDGHGWTDDLTHDWGNARSSAFLRINATGHLVGQHIEDIGLSNLRLGRQLT